MLRRYRLLAVALGDGRRSGYAVPNRSSNNRLLGSSSDPVFPITGTQSTPHKRSSATSVLIASSMFGTLLADEPVALTARGSSTRSLFVTYVYDLHRLIRHNGIPRPNISDHR